MDYKDKVVIIKEQKTADNYGGFATEMVEIGNIRVKVAPYKVGIVIVNVNDREAYKYSMRLYDKLNSLQILLHSSFQKSIYL